MVPRERGEGGGAASRYEDDVPDVMVLEWANFLSARAIPRNNGLEALEARAQWRMMQRRVATVSQAATNVYNQTIDICERIDDVWVEKQVISCVQSDPHSVRAASRSSRLRHRLDAAWKREFMTFRLDPSHVEVAST